MGAPHHQNAAKASGSGTALACLNLAMPVDLDRALLKLHAQHKALVPVMTVSLFRKGFA